MVGWATAVSIPRRPFCVHPGSEREWAFRLSHKLAENETIGTAPAGQSGWALFRAGWRAILWRGYQKMNDNRLLAVAAGAVFYGLLALFPTVTAFVSLYGLIADPSTIHERADRLTRRQATGMSYYSGTAEITPVRADFLVERRGFEP
jgi:hypothetical protein